MIVSHIKLRDTYDRVFALLVALVYDKQAVRQKEL